MTNEEKCIENLAGKDITAKRENGTIYVVVGEVQLELSQYEIDFNIKEYNEQNPMFTISVSGAGTHDEIGDGLELLTDDVQEWKEMGDIEWSKGGLTIKIEQV